MRVHTAATAERQSRLAQAKTTLAKGGRWADLPTLPAVFRVCSRIDAGPIAFGLSRGALAVASRTGLPDHTFFGAATTVIEVRLGIHAGIVAELLP